jgi:hypothetical protein
MTKAFMKRIRIPGLIDVVQVDDPAKIRELAASPEMDRRFHVLQPLLNGLLLRRTVKALTLRGRRFPAMRPREEAHRAQEQDELWTKLNAIASTTKLGPQDLEALARWVRGTGTDTELGILVQEAVGRLFSPSYTADEASWSAALLLRDAPRSIKPFKLAWWWATGRVRKAKALLAEKVGGDMMGVHGTGITVHNIVKGFHQMRTLYATADSGSKAAAETVAAQCLFAPPSVMRQATSEGKIGGCPFTRQTLFILGLSEARKRADSKDMVFLENSWSRCPADTWVPALFEGVWKRATENLPVK